MASQPAVKKPSHKRADYDSSVENQQSQVLAETLGETGLQFLSALPLPSLEEFTLQINQPRSLESIQSNIGSRPGIGFTKSSTQTPPRDNMAAAIIPILVSLAEPFFTDVLEPSAKEAVQRLQDGLKEELDDFHRKHPGQTFWEVLGKYLLKWAEDNHVEEKILAKLNLAAFAAKVSNISSEFIDWVEADPNVKTPQDLAIHWDTAKITSVLKGAVNRATEIRQRIFHELPAATIKGAVKDGKVGLLDQSQDVKNDVVKSLGKMDGMDLTKKSPAALITQDPNIVSDVPANRLPNLKKELTRLAELNAIAPSTQALENVSQQLRTDSVSITNVSEKQFVQQFGGSLGDDVARQTYHLALANRFRNESILTNLLQYIRGTGLAAIDGDESRESRKWKVQQALDDRGANISLENLFGSMDQLLVDESSTIYGAASYLVDLLEYLRNTSALEGSLPAATTPGGQPDIITGTVLEFLFKRRPDIGNLLLTAENTDTVMPYIDISNEIMESFITNLTSYNNDASKPKQVQIDAFDVANGEDSDDLLSQPQNINVNAYRELAAATYPMSLPYSQPLDAQRIFLQFLNVTRADLAQAFRPRIVDLSDPAHPMLKVDEEISRLQRQALNNQIHCERLGLIQEEFLILTKTVFWQREFFEKTEHITLTDQEYQSRVSLKSTCECWGYRSNEEMLADSKKGLRSVAAQLLPRAGIAFTDLIDIVQTEFVNPDFPSGQNKVILESLRSSYRFLQTLVDPDMSSSTGRYKRLIDYLITSNRVFDLSQMLQDTQSKLIHGQSLAQRSNGTVKSEPITDGMIKNWVLNNFAQMGKIVVLDAGEAPRLEVFGKISAVTVVSVPNVSPSALTEPPKMANLADGKIIDDFGNALQSGWIANLAQDGTLTDSNNNVIGHVLIGGKVVYGNSRDDFGFNDKFPNLSFTLDQPSNFTVTWKFEDNFLKKISPGSRALKAHIVEWVLPAGLGGSGSIQNTRLQHLDGSSLTVEEWDRLHRFIRIWSKLGWSVSDTDRALLATQSQLPKLALSTNTTAPITPGDNTIHWANGTVTNRSISSPRTTPMVTFDNFVDPAGLDVFDKPITPTPRSQLEITPSVIEELTAITQLLSITGLPLNQLLTLWTTMSYKGRSSLFYKLFFTRNLRGTDSAFAADPDENYFQDPSVKISDHQGTIAAAFSLKLADIDYMLCSDPTKYGRNLLPPAFVVPDALNMEALSCIYRYKTFANILQIKITDLGDVLIGFAKNDSQPDPQTLKDLQDLSLEPLFGNPFQRPTILLGILGVWQQMQNLPMPWEQLRYIADTVPTPNDPLAPTKLETLLLAKTLQDGIANIESTYPLMKKDQLKDNQTTEDLITKSAALVYDDATVKSILNLLKGTTIYSAKVDPPLPPELESVVGDLLPERNFKYNPPVTSPAGPTETPSSATLQFEGILSEQEIATIKAAVPKPSGPKPQEQNEDEQLPQSNGENEEQKKVWSGWNKAVDSARFESHDFFYDKLSLIFPNTDAQTSQGKIILAPDKPVLLQPTASATPGKLVPLLLSRSASAAPDHSVNNLNDANDTTFQAKSFALMQYLISFLRNKLIYTFVIDTIVSKAGFNDRTVTETMVNQIITVDNSPNLNVTSKLFSDPSALGPNGTNEKAIEFLTREMGSSPDVWRGFLKMDAATSSSYTFYLDKAVFDSFKNKHPPSPTFALYAGDKWPREWALDSVTGKMALSIGKSSPDSYMLEISENTRLKLKWSINNGPVQPIPEENFVWKGYLNPPNSDNYVLCLENDPKQPIFIDNVAITFAPQYAGSKTWCTGPIYLDATKLHSLQFPYTWFSGLEWRSGSSSRSKIPGTSLLSDFAGSQMQVLYGKLTKMALLLSHFTLSSDEILYFHKTLQEDLLQPKQSPRFDYFGFDGLKSIQQFMRLCNYVKLRDGLPSRTSQSLLDLFSWASSSQNDGSVSLADIQQQVTSATSWPLDVVAQIIDQANFLNRTPGDFVNEQKLLLIQSLVSLSALLGVNPETLFAWATPLGTNTHDFDQYATNASDIQGMARSRFSIDAWSQAVRPLNDKLRQHQNAALIAYLLSQREFVAENNIVDADSLFEFFLIDVQTQPLVETSRIKQAISSIQTFIQRCMMGLEEPSVDSNVLDRSRWNWMQRYRVWQANRKVFLYPENYIDSSLRDDKTEIFKQLESALLQKNLNKDVVYSAFRSYVYSLDTVACMQAIGIYVEYNTIIASQVDKIHIVARTKATPFAYFYNFFTPEQTQTFDGQVTKPSQGDGSWAGWQSMAIDIPHYCTTAIPNPSSSTATTPITGIIGNHVALTIFGGRLLLFCAQLVSKTIPADLSQKDTKTAPLPVTSLSSDFLTAASPQQAWDISLSWSELRDGKWTQRVTCPDSFLDSSPPGTTGDPAVDKTHPAVDSYSLVPTAIQADIPVKPSSSAEDSSQNPSSAQTQAIKVYLNRPGPSAVAAWLFNGNSLTLGDPKAAGVQSSADTLLPGVKLSFGTRCISDGTTELHSLQAFESSQPPVQDKPVKDKPAEDKPAEDKPAEDKPAEDKPPNPEQTPSQVKTPTANAFIQDIGPISPTKLFTTAPGSTGPMITLPDGANLPFYHRHIHALTSAAVGQGDLSQFLTVLNSFTDDVVDMFGGTTSTTGTFNERRSLYAIYNWEMGFHAPMRLADQLFKAQQYDQAISVCQYVFNPTGPGRSDKTTGNSNKTSRFWNFAPFKTVTQSSLDFAMSDAKAINDWRNNPFMPDVVARDRPTAYMKWIVMMYIRILIAYGDSLFTQNTLESVQMAVQYYVLASHIYGPRGQRVPRQDKIKPCSYNDLAGKFDQFSNAVVQLGQAFPFSNQTTLPMGKLPGSNDLLIPNIFGFAGTDYFAIPDNPNLRDLATTIDDRLFKIRNSQDINGVTRILPLFEPPIDPMLLVQAAAQGLSLSSVVQSLNSTISDCRFEILLQKAIELTEEVKGLGQTLLSIREKKDGETFSSMQVQHELALYNIIMEQKKLAVDDATSAVAQLQYSRTSAMNRLQYYFALVGQDLSGVPTLDQEFQALDTKIDIPVSDGGLAISPMEELALQTASAANDLSSGIAVLELTAGTFQSLPNINVDGKPIGVGTTWQWGPANWAAVATTAARGIKIQADSLSYTSSNTSTKSQYQRALQDRILQANAAGYEVSSIDKQITAANIRIAMANKDIDIQQNQIDSAQEVADFVRNKYSNAELYSWMDGKMKTVYYSTYTQALNLAMKAQRAFDLERPNGSPGAYIQPGYWDASRDGLFSGEALYLGLKQLEAAALDNKGYKYEITKSISLRQIDPLALINLRELGSCKISIPEVLFDMDFPGHYLRRIKSVSVTLPCLVGPYTSINATLTLLDSQIRASSRDPNEYQPKLDTGLDDRFIIGNTPTSAIAVCSGQSDSGTFQLDFAGTRFMPFEGAGAISNWSLELPPYNNTPMFRQFAYDSITDVILQIRYTSLEDTALKKGAIASVTQFIQATQNIGTSNGLVAVFDIRNDFASGWARFLQLSTGKNSGTGRPALALSNLNERLPMYVRPRGPGQIHATNIAIVTDGDSPVDNQPGVSISDDDIKPFEGPTTLPSSTPPMHVYTLDGIDFQLGNWNLYLGQIPSKATKCWMIVKYHLS